MTMGSTAPVEESEATADMVSDLVHRAKALLAELEMYRARLKSLRKEAGVEVNHFQGTVQSELKMLERLGEKPIEEQTTGHVARSSNLPYLETLWATAKRSKDITALQKRVFLAPTLKARSQSMRLVEPMDGTKNSRGSAASSVVVDLISDSGRTWHKISLVTNSRLLFDLAKQGWDSGGSDEEDSDRPPLPDDDDHRDVPLLMSAKQLTTSAAHFRVRTRAPAVHMILPRVVRGETPEVDAILDGCRAAGAVLICGKPESAVPAIEKAIHSMATDPLLSFSDTLNVDCTILLALVSEFSHAKVSKQPWFHNALKRQVEIEDNEQLLPSLLYPAMASRKLVCTKEAAQRMREIVDTIGTPSEKARTAILLGDDPAKSQQDLVSEMRDWSYYDVPTHWQLPIKVVDQNEDDCQSKLPVEVGQVARGMTAINSSVFLYGWASGSTTITSNRTVVKQLESDLEQFDDLDDGVWPSIWLCPTARSLVGKEKRGPKKAADADDATGTAWPLPDPLRREQQRRHGLDVLSQREGRTVEDLRPNGYPCDEVLAAKNASQR